jgi:two-component system nitrate/nitrite response regulator NarL
MRVLLADDHKLVRDALAFYCTRLDDEVEVLQAETYGQVAEMEAGADALDLIILDLNMPGGTGFDGLDAMRKRRPQTPIVILSGSVRRQDMSDAFEHGASGYLPKTLGGDAMLNALRLVMAGEKFIPAALYEEAGGAGGAANLPADSPLRALTPREREVLEQLIEGKSNKEIATVLDLQVVTVKLHMKGILRKLGAHNRTHAVKIALDLKSAA